MRNEQHVKGGHVGQSDLNSIILAMLILKSEAIANSMQVSIPCSTFKVDVDEMTDGSVLAVLLQFIIDSTLYTSKVFVLGIVKGFFSNKPFLYNFVYNLFYFNGYCGCPDVGYGSLETRYFWYLCSNYWAKWPLFIFI